MHFDVTTLDDVKAPTKLDRFVAKRKSRCPCDARGRQARFARDEIINLAARNLTLQTTKMSFEKVLG